MYFGKKSTREQRHQRKMWTFRLRYTGNEFANTTTVLVSSLGKDFGLGNNFSIIFYDT